jgi:polysaccharide biosynthesis protein PslJ
MPTAMGLPPAILVVGYALLLLLLPTQMTIGPLGGAGSPATLAGLLAALLWAAHRFVGPDVGPQPVVFVTAFLFAAVFASYVVANSRILLAVEQSNSDRMILVLLGWVGVALLAADSLGRADLDRVVSAVVMAGSVVAAIGMAQYLTGFDVMQYYAYLPGLTENTDLTAVGERSILRRVNGTASHPIEFGVALGMILPLAVHRAFSAGITHRRRQWVPVLLIAVAVPMTVSRSGTIAVLVAGVVLAAGWNRGQRLRALIVVPPFVIVLRFLFPGLMGTIASLFLGIQDDDSVKGRTEDYDVVSEYVSSSPWFGRGFGTFLPTEYELIDNQYLGFLIETGFVGLTALLALFVVGIGLGRGARLRAADARTRDLAQALTAALCVPAVTFATFDGFAFPMVSGLSFLMLGCAGALWRINGGFRKCSGWAERVLGPEPTQPTQPTSAGRSRTRGVSERLRHLRPATRRATNVLEAGRGSDSGR